MNQLDLFATNPETPDLPLTRAELLHIIEAAGYTSATVHKFQHVVEQLLEFTIAGIECENCALHFESEDLGTTSGAWAADSIRARTRHEVVDNALA
jgi:hypothetical protein